MLVQIIPCVTAFRVTAPGFLLLGFLHESVTDGGLWGSPGGLRAQQVEEEEVKEEEGMGGDWLSSL
jgi:hypothetical protein